MKVMKPRCAVFLENTMFNKIQSWTHPQHICALCPAPMGPCDFTALLYNNNEYMFASRSPTHGRLKAIFLRQNIASFALCPLLDF